jgi:hypothetical protein
MHLQHGMVSRYQKRIWGPLLGQRLGLAKRLPVGISPHPEHKALTSASPTTALRRVGTCSSILPWALQRSVTLRLMCVH